MTDGRATSITQRRIDFLEELGFCWNAQQGAWASHLRDLKEFKRVHGHCHCPLDDKQFPKLGLWVKEQRRHYTLMKQGKSSHMNEERCRQLNEINFCWDTHHATWQERLQELADFKAQRGHCSVPTNYHDNAKLATWVSTVASYWIEISTLVGFFILIRAFSSQQHQHSGSSPTTPVEAVHGGRIRSYHARTY